MLALAAGALQVCAYAPLDLPIFAVLAPMSLLLLLRDATPARGAWLGLLYGLGLFGVGIHWIYFSLHLFGEAIAPLSALLTGGFVLGMALYPGALGYLLCRHKAPVGVWMLVLAPAGWTLAEWLRGWVLSGFPWLLLGHTQTDWPLAGYFPLLGVYGVSWTLALTAGAMALLLGTRMLSVQRVAVLGLCVLMWIGGFALQQVRWSTPVGEPVRVRMVQGNVGQEEKFIAEMLQRSLDVYTRLSIEGPPVDLVIWPETAIPTFYHRVAELLEAVAGELRAAGAELAIGVLEYRQEERRYFNAVRKVTPEGGPGQMYLKRHLVPFGEYMPLRDLLEFIARYITIPMSDLDAGAWRQAPLPLAGYLAGVSICYEDAFGEEVITQLPAANFLVNVSNDAWFGDSIAPHQHLQIARVRALETARPMARATNTGISAFIDHDGRILARSPQFAAHALDASIQPRAGATPYVRYGNYMVVVALLLVLGIAIVAGRSSRNRQ
ncbi:MAG: apolipoprotein N-acyltransferase [Gammaproteobacteria bacterium]|nr:apolipoprotein N-acyltransferase [Gammaproteobacteria bacterium]